MRKGFTLVELIIVVIIIGILAAVGIPQYLKAIEKARGAEGYSGLGHIQEAEKIYYANNEAYYNASTSMGATEEAALDINLPQTGWNFTITAANATTFVATATRKAGRCVGKTMNMTETGSLNDTDWKNCAEQ